MKKHAHPTYVLVLTSLLLLFTLVGGTWNTAFGAGLATTGMALPQSALIIPTFEIVSVLPDQTVTIRTYNFPANDTFDVLMNTIGTRGVGGTKVDSTASGAGGSFTATYTIPAGLKGKSQIAIRLESPTSGYYSYNWFWNNTTTGGIPNTGDTPVPTLPAGTIPTFTITAVDPGKTVTIQTANFPANDSFNVLMGLFGTRGVGGTKVDTISSGSGGTFTKTFNIPGGLAGLSTIAIRLESPTSGYYSYNWFYNSSTSGGIPNTGGTPVPTLPAGTIPTFTVTSVSGGKTVTIQTANFPANDTFNITMGAYGTRGVNGTSAGTFNSSTGGTQTATINIPAGLSGYDRIAIRLYSPTSGYYSYNWFYNSTYP